MQTLNDFYRYMQDRIDSGKIPYPQCGLCFHLQGWIIDNAWGLWEIENQMRKQFEEAGLDPTHPFDHSISSYLNSGTEKTVWKNEKRLAWVKDHATL